MKKNHELMKPLRMFSVSCVHLLRMDMMKNLYVMLLVVVMVMPCITAQGAKKKKKGKIEQADSMLGKKPESKYDKLLKKPGVETARGNFVTIHKIAEKVYFEYPLKNLGREVLLGGTVSASSNGTFVNVGYKLNDPLYLQFKLQDSMVCLYRPNTLVAASSDDAGVRKAMEQNYIPNLLKKFPVEAYNADSTAVVFDVTSLLKNNSQLSPDGENDVISTTADKENFSFGRIRAFEDNVSVEISQNVDVTLQSLFFPLKLGKISTRSIISMLLLPKKKMKPRLADARVGVFPTGCDELFIPMSKLYISQEKDGVCELQFANRWRLESKDEIAWERGELVEPVNPIVYYLDDAFPKEWKAPIRAGVLRWNKAFEKIGFKNAVQIRDFPKNDSEFDPDNLKYSCIRYSPTATANAMGPSWVDPSTGEILNASVIIYHDIIRLINNWRFIQTAQVDPRVRVQKMPEDIVEESIAYVVAHEVGHTLGLMHNMAASAAYPVDSLRSASFTRKYGTTASIMDYARYNYVAQPADKGVKLTPPDLGVYDEYVIKWLYSPIPGNRNMWEEAQIVEKWVDEKAGDPCYRFGRQQLRYRYDPSSIEEDLGDDPIKAGSYGIKNLKYILGNLNTWVDEEGSVDHRQELYGQILDQYLRYIMNVMYRVGGIYLTQVKDGTPGIPYLAVDCKTQKESLAWIIRELRSCDWVNAKELTGKFDLATNSSSKLCGLMSRYFLTTLASNVTLSAHVSENPYSVREYFDDLYTEIFSSTIRGRRLTEGEKIMQRIIMSDIMMAASKGKGQGGSKITGNNEGLRASSDLSVLPSIEEIRAYGLDQSGFVGLNFEQLKQFEDCYGKGVVANQLLARQFGEDRQPYQSEVNVNMISEINAYKKAMLNKVYFLVKGMVATADRDDKAHYEGILMDLRGMFK